MLPSLYFIYNLATCWMKQNCLATSINLLYLRVVQLVRMYMISHNFQGDEWWTNNIYSLSTLHGRWDTLQSVHFTNTMTPEVQKQNNWSGEEVIYGLGETVNSSWGTVHVKRCSRIKWQQGLTKLTQATPLLFSTLSSNWCCHILGGVLHLHTSLA